MSDYRRLISYLYAYEGGNKGKNIGYAKLEVREETCRIQISVKKVYVGSSDVGVYLLVSGSEVMLGKIFIRNGAGEFRIQVNAADIEGSGYTMEDCYGLTIHDTQNAWQSYTTIWEDAVSQAAQVQLAEVTAEKVRQEKVRQEQQENREKQEEQELPISAEIERELELEEVKLEAEAPWEGDSEPEPAVQGSGIRESAAQDPAAQDPAAQNPASQDSIAQGSIAQGSTAQDLTAQERVKQSLTTQTPVASEPTISESVISDPVIPEPEDLAKLEELDRQERETAARRHLWSRLQNLHTKVLAFDYDNGCEILSIKPQDIGLLPREIWIYGNNSFLLHGYYNYRHLILARLNNPQGEPRYLLGVPGHYFSNEKYMASMFGFPHFVLARKQPEGDGRFGYWYTDIRL